MDEDTASSQEDYPDSFEFDDLSDYADDGMEGDEYDFEDEIFGDPLLEEKPREETGMMGKTHYEVLSKQAVLNQQEEMIAKVKEVVEADASIIRLFLSSCNWNVEQLLSEYYEDPDKLFKKAGVSTETEKPKVTSTVECDVCMEDIAPEEVCCLSCGHLFCSDCWRQYLTISITQEGRKSNLLTCMARGCKVAMEQSMVEKLVDKEVFEKYKNFVVDTFVDNHPMMNWCPGPGCSNAIRVKTPGNMSLAVTCDCSEKFCFRCQCEAHAPATCTMLKYWSLKESDNSETINWLLCNSKNCPKCDKPVEKNGGCNHITCSCGAHFCWMCLGVFDQKKVYNHGCNMFEDKTAFDGDKAKSAEALLKRYTHYSERFNNHNASKKLESKLLETVRLKANRLADLDTGNSSWIDQRYLEESAKQLCLCRGILKYTYVFAFYIFDPNYSQGNTRQILEDIRPWANKKEAAAAKQQFEFHQEELETTTELLSGHLEMGVAEIRETKDYRIKVIDLTKLALNKFNAMFGVVQWIRTTGATGEYKTELVGGDEKGKGKEIQQMETTQDEEDLQQLEEQLLSQAIEASLRSSVG